MWGRGHSLRPRVYPGHARCLLAAALLLATAACGTRAPAKPPAILLFAGRGTSPNDVAALERILRDRRLSYATIDSSRLNAMNENELRASRLLIVPGGNFVDMGNGLEQATSARVRHAVRRGVNYLGICAGAFIAGHSPYNGFDLTS